MNTEGKFAGGRNIAMKVPPHFYEAIVQFYRDVVGLKLLENRPPSIGFEFGGNQLWIDRVPGLGGAILRMKVERGPAALERFKKIVFQTM